MKPAITDPVKHHQRDPVSCPFFIRQYGVKHFIFPVGTFGWQAQNMDHADQFSGILFGAQVHFKSRSGHQAHADRDRLAGRHPSWSRMSNAVTTLYAISLQADAAALRNSAEQRYRDLLANHPDLIARISRRDLACFLNVTDVALGRIAKRVEAGAVESD